MIDDIDRSILTAVQEDASLTSEQLGARCGLSPAAALKRVKRLRAAGIITRDVALVDGSKLGQSVQMIVMVSFGRESRDVIDRFKRAIKDEPRILQGFYITGEADFMLLITAKDMTDYEEFTRDFFYDRNGIQRFNTFVVLDPVKPHAAVPVDL